MGGGGGGGGAGSGLHLLSSYFDAYFPQVAGWSLPRGIGKTYVDIDPIQLTSVVGCRCQ